MLAQAERYNEFGILIPYRSKAEVPYEEWVAEVPTAMKRFDRDLRKAHKLGMSASTAVLLLHRERHITFPGAERVGGTNGIPEKKSGGKLMPIIDRLTPDQADFLVTKLMEMGYA